MFNVDITEVVPYLKRNSMWFYPVDPSLWYLLNPKDKSTTHTIEKITPNMTRSQALVYVNLAIGSQWRDPILGTRYES